MAKETLPKRLVRGIERTLQDRIDDVKSKVAEHYEQCRADLSEIAETFGVEEEELFALANVPKPEEKKRRRRKKAAKKKVVKKKAVARKKVKKKAGEKVKTQKKRPAKKRGPGTAEEKVAAVLKENPAASGADLAAATGYSGKTVYNTNAWKNRPQSQ